MHICGFHSPLLLFSLCLPVNVPLCECVCVEGGGMRVRVHTWSPAWSLFLCESVLMPTMFSFVSNYNSRTWILTTKSQMTTAELNLIYCALFERRENQAISLIAVAHSLVWRCRHLERRKYHDLKMDGKMTLTWYVMYLFWTTDKSSKQIITLAHNIERRAFEKKQPWREMNGILT